MKIEKCTNKDLIKKGAQYFEAKPELTELFVSPDGQFFYTVGASVHHCTQKATIVSRITRDMLIKPKTAPKKPKKQKENGKNNL